MRTIFFFLLCAYLISFSTAQVDQDGDGFYTTSQYPALKDCCDSITNCPNPYLVNPAAQEILGNGIDDNCDSLIDIVESCSSVVSPTITSQFVFDSSSATAQIMPAIDIYSCSDGQNVNWGWQGLYQVVLQLANGDPQGVSGPSNLQFAIFNQFGEIGPQKGVTFFAMSTGQARNPGDPGYDASTYGNTTIGNSAVVIPPLWGKTTIPQSSTCTTIKKRDLFYGYYYNSANYAYTYNVPYSGYYVQTPATNKALDSARLRFTFKQPSNFNGFAFKVKFANSAKEMPVTNQCSTNNDYFIVLKETPLTTPNLPADHNIAKTKLGADFQSLNSLDSFYTECQPTQTSNFCRRGPRALKGSPFTGATDWSYIGASATPSEIFNISFNLWDSSNTFVDSSAMIDAYAPVAEGIIGGSGAFASGYIPTSDIELVSAVTPVTRFKTSTTSVTNIPYTITIRNNGPEATSDVYVSFTLPVGVTFTPGSGLSCVTLPATGAIYPLQKCRVTSISLTTNVLQSGQSVIVKPTITVPIGYTGTLKNSFWATCSSVNLDASNDFVYSYVTFG